MKLNNPNASVFFPGEKDLSGITDLCIAAHQDDVEIMAYGPISNCYGKHSFAAVIVTDGGGSPRTGEFAGYTDEEMKAVRQREQTEAATLGEYRAVIQLGYPSSAVKNGSNDAVIGDLCRILLETRPKLLYTHNPADKHPTHVAVSLRVIEAVRRLSPDYRPEVFVGLEVWRGLDWLCDADKMCLDTGAYPELARKLLTVHRSQVAGGKRYDEAAIGRRAANATFFAAHETDESNSMNFGLDLLPLINSNVSPAEYVGKYVQRFEEEIIETIKNLS